MCKKNIGVIRIHLHFGASQHIKEAFEVGFAIHKRLHRDLYLINEIITETEEENKERKEQD